MGRGRRAARRRGGAAARGECEHRRLRARRFFRSQFFFAAILRPSTRVARMSGTSPETRDAAPREITPRAIVLGLGLALLLGAANAYLGLYAGMTVSASIPAAVISMAVLRALGARDDSRKQRGPDDRLGRRGGRGGRDFHLSRAGGAGRERRAAVSRRHDAVRGRGHDGQSAGGLSAPRLYRRRAPAVSRRRRVRRGPARRRGHRRERAAAFVGRTCRGRTQGRAGHRGSAAGRGAVGAMDRSAGAGRFGGHLGGAAGDRLYHRNSNREPGLRRRRFRLAGRDPDHERVPSGVAQSRSAGRGARVMERTGALPRRGRDAGRRRCDALAPASTDRAGAPREHPRWRVRLRQRP